MISNSTTQLNNLKSPSRKIKCELALFKEGVNYQTYFNSEDDLIEIKVERVGENSKFFGFGVSHKATAKIRDINREKVINKDDYIHAYFSTNETNNYFVVTPYLYIKEVSRDENTNNITIVAYDKLFKANEITVSELGLNEAYSINNLLNGIKTALGVVDITGIDTTTLTNIPEVANLDGTETLRAVLDDIAEITGTFYSIDKGNKLVFKQLKKDTADLTITKSDYFTLSNKGSYTLNSIAHITELGDNIEATAANTTGEKQYIRENCFLNNNDNAQKLLSSMVEKTKNITIYDFVLSWRGNFLIEVGDRIDITTKDNKTITTYVINDSYNYTGGFKQETNWSYTPSEAVNTNPVTIGEAINQTKARVDKINKEIILIAAEATEASEKAAAIELTVNGIDSTVKEFQETINSEVTRIDEAVTQISQKADTIELSVTTLEENIGKDIDATNKKVAELVLKDDEIALSVTNLSTSFEETIEEINADITLNTEGINIANSKIDANTEALAAININTESITSTVEKIEKNTSNSLESLNDSIVELGSKITQTAKDLQLEFNEKITTEAESVTTSTGFTFNSSGLTIDKSGSEIKTQITENGMTVYRNNKAMLVANNAGVDATNLRATTYLIIGNKSRFETMKNGRTGCFWIG